MSPHELEMQELEERLSSNRRQLSATVAELADWLRPANLVNAGVDYLAGKAATAARDAVNIARKNSGKVTLVGAGALLAFDLGRLTSTPSDQPTAAEPFGDPVYQSNVEPSAPHYRSIMDSWRTLGYWGGGAVAAVIGYALGTVIPVSTAETELLGGMPSEVKSAADQFWKEHARGAKLAAADSFGLARWTAVGLALMAAMARLLKPETDGPV
jgi:hypothetical protein